MKNLKVSDIMSRQPKTIEPGRDIQFAAQAMIKYGIGSLIVVDSFELVGIITERDIIRAFAESMRSETPVKSVMTKNVITIKPSTTMKEAARLMVKNKIKRLPVCVSNKCIGIVTATDLMKQEDHMVDKLAFLYHRRK